MGVQRKRGLPDPSGGGYRQFGYSTDRDTHKKNGTDETKTDDSTNSSNSANAANNIDNANNNNNVPRAVSSVSGMHGVSNLVNSPPVNIVNPNTTNIKSVSSSKKSIKNINKYEHSPQKIALEEELDKLVRQLTPDLCVKCKINETGQIITSVINIKTKKVVREFPTEKILDILRSMSKKLGMVATKKI